ncbi:helix-turn-helix domain-containing protein [Arthrobacter sp. NEB 688]|uniref:winged helix-turn-helix transcriptional regulator n=1 Tax=Arthrobacter sp. NEB 688 TaxID=904039 RepID=UPI00156649D8|nr:helix-turn-helix domain-containing protein [Arthrobacter sp. NEB 688]QKE82639.1 helix-turn-helix transcriptional regulator [Arthrobacter sp. NEB 688]
MPRSSPVLATAIDNPCAIIRALGVLSDTWTFLVVREAFLGASTFARFREALGISTDVLTVRLAALVEHGVLVRTPYREPGRRVREAYHLTPAGQELVTVLAALQQWGHDHVGDGAALRVAPVTDDDRQPVRAHLVDPAGREVPPQDVRFELVEGSPTVA